ncbi:MAG: ribonuclease III [Eubacteriaceae bacterium]|nr:ribonuclease III [Eubacteriaceae bacterium]
MEDSYNAMLDRFCDETGYHFKNRQLLITALTHTSRALEEGSSSNERLEFLGDAVLELIVSDYLFEREALKDEGALTKLRALIVCTDSLDTTARAIGLDALIRLDRGAELSGLRNNKTLTEDAMESLIAAIYLDSGYEAARDFVMRTHSPVIEKALQGGLKKDYKTALQEKVMKEKLGELSYELVEVSGPDHRRTFTSRAVLNGEAYPAASGDTIKKSEQNAARILLEILNSN